MKLTAEQTELLLDCEAWLGFHEEDAKLRQRYARGPLVTRAALRRGMVVQHNKVILAPGRWETCDGTEGYAADCFYHGLYIGRSGIPGYSYPGEHEDRLAMYDDEVPSLPPADCCDDPSPSIHNGQRYCQSCDRDLR